VARWRNSVCHRSIENIAVGDAENDLAFLDVCGAKPFGGY
jgi:hypothetical protein